MFKINDYLYIEGNSIFSLKKIPANDGGYDIAPSLAGIQIAQQDHYKGAEAILLGSWIQRLDSMISFDDYGNLQVKPEIE